MLCQAEDTKSLITSGADFGLRDQIRLKQTGSATETSDNIELLHAAIK